MIPPNNSSFTPDAVFIQINDAGLSAEHENKRQASTLPNFVYKDGLSDQSNPLTTSSVSDMGLLPIMRFIPSSQQVPEMRFVPNSSQDSLLPEVRFIPNSPQPTRRISISSQEAFQHQAGDRKYHDSNQHERLSSNDEPLSPVDRQKSMQLLFEDAHKAESSTIITTEEVQESLSLEYLAYNKAPHPVPRSILERFKNVQRRLNKIHLSSTAKKVSKSSCGISRCCRNEAVVPIRPRDIAQAGPKESVVIDIYSDPAEEDEAKPKKTCCQKVTGCLKRHETLSSLMALGKAGIKFIPGIWEVLTIVTDLVTDIAQNINTKESADTVAESFAVVWAERQGLILELVNIFEKLGNSVIERFVEYTPSHPEVMEVLSHQEDLSEEITEVYKRNEFFQEEFVVLDLINKLLPKRDHFEECFKLLGCDEDEINRILNPLYYRLDLVRHRHKYPSEIENNESGSIALEAQDSNRSVVSMSSIPPTPDTQVINLRETINSVYRDARKKQCERLLHDALNIKETRKATDLACKKQVKALAAKQAKILKEQELRIASAEVAMERARQSFQNQIDALTAQQQKAFAKQERHIASTDLEVDRLRAVLTDERRRLMITQAYIEQLESRLDDQAAVQTQLANTQDADRRTMIQLSAKQTMDRRDIERMDRQLGPCVAYFQALTDQEQSNRLAQLADLREGLAGNHAFFIANGIPTSSASGRSLLAGSTQQSATARPTSGLQRRPAASASGRSLQQSPTTRPTSGLQRRSAADSKRNTDS